MPVNSSFIEKEWLCLLLLFLITTSKSMGAEEATSLDLPASYDQTTDLASAVCAELFSDPRNESMVKICERNFINYRRNMTADPVELQIKCRQEEYLEFTVTPREHWQLVALINTERRADEIINYIIVDPMTNHSGMYVPRGEYTVWTTALNEHGSPAMWTEGPEILPWDDIQRNLGVKNYDIQINFLPQTFDQNTYFIDAIISWGSDIDIDSCFDVLNYCNKKTQGDIYEKKVHSYQAPAVTVKGLPVDDSCSVRVKGLYGVTTATYRTVSCYNITGCTPLPDMVRNISMKAEQTDESKWAVLVSWARPDHAPAQYNVTLTADYPQNKIVPGNSTAVSFQQVRGDGIYSVMVEAQAGRQVARTSKSDLFPPRAVSPADASLLLEAVLMLGFLCTSALTCGAVCWRRRLNAKRRNIYFANVLEKMAGVIDTDAESPESGSEDQWEVRPERLVLHEVIGEGAFGVVRRGSLAPSNKDVAVKMLKDFPSVEEIRSFRSEMELMKSVGAHRHVVSLVGCCSGRRPLILAEYCSRGDLLTFLRCSWDVMTSRRNAKYYNNNKEVAYRLDLMKSKDSKLVINRLYDLQGVCEELTVLDLLSFCRQIAMGMEFLESNRVVHRDLAARNVLVTADKTLKIADFGLSRDIYQENQYKQKGNGKMPVKWMALESLTQRIYTTQSDVWSFGVVMWEVATVGGAPYAGVSAARLPRLLAAGYRMPRPHNCSPKLYDLMLSCWNSRPRSRPTFSELHAALDAMLCARADHYLPLAVSEEAPPSYSPQESRRSYLVSLARNSLLWGRSKGYERPHTNSNHYTAQPALVAPHEIDVLATPHDVTTNALADSVQPT